MKDYYLILNIEPNATLDEVKQAYRTMSQKYHPDKNKGDRYFEERFKDIHEAYEVLSTISLRQEYDYQWMRYFKTETEKSNNKKTISVTTPLKGDENEIKKITSKNKGRNIGIIIFILVIISTLLVILFTMKSTYEDQVNSLTSELRFITKYHDDEVERFNKRIEELEKELQGQKEIQRQTRKSENLKKQIQLPAGSVDISRNVTAVNLDEIKISSVEWEYGDFSLPNKRQLQNVSILNKTTMTIKKVVVFYEVFSAAGTPINSEELIYNIEILPNTAKKCRDYKKNYLDWINNSDKVVITVKSFETSP